MLDCFLGETRRGRRYLLLAALLVGCCISLWGCSVPILVNIPIATYTPTVAVGTMQTPDATTTPPATATPAATQVILSITGTATPMPTPTKPASDALLVKGATPLASAEIRSATCPTSGEIVQTTYFSPIQNSERNVRVYLPPCYGEDGYSYPVLYMLHGSPQSDRTWDEVLQLDESAEMLINQRKIPPLIIVMPDGRPLSQTSSGGPKSFEDVLINELIPFVEQSWCASPRRPNRAIGGVSRGGYWATEIAFRHVRMFGSVGAHSAAFLDDGDSERINPLYTGATNNLRGLRLYFDFGRDDTLANVAEPLHEALLDRGIAHEWIVQSFGGHTEEYWLGQTKTYLQWYAEPWSFRRETYGFCRSTVR